jgi:hypothetical protein
MNKDKINALIREIRTAAESLPAGKRRDVNNKLDRITLALRSGSGPEDVTHDEVADMTGHFKSQAEAVLAWMQAGHTITSLEALQRFGIISFPRRILDIEKMTGTAPKRKRIQVTNRSGKAVYVNQYWWEE